MFGISNVTVYKIVPSGVECGHHEGRSLLWSGENHINNHTRGIR